MKKCTKCSNKYPATNEYFNKDVSKKDFLHSHCRNCSKKNKSNYYLLNRNRLIQESIIYQRNNEKSRARKYKYAKSEKGIIAYKKWKLENKEDINKKEKDRINTNPDYKQRRIESQKKYVENNREKINEKARLKIKIRDKQKESLYKKKSYDKFKNDPYWKLIHYSRVRMNSIVKNNAKQFKIKDMVLYSKEEFIYHIESLFSEGMSWGNHGKMGWHIDHIKPISSFDLNDINECIECWSLKNLQPLWWSDNLKKGSKINLN